MLTLPARRGRRARRHEHHRVGHRHPAGQHADRRARRHLRPGPALPDPRARRPLARARLRLPAVPQRRRADRGGDEAPERAERLHRARRRLQDRDARPRDPRRRQPARRRAVRPRRGARLRALPVDARRGGRAADGRRRAATTSPSPCASTSTSTPTCPADYVPYEQAKIDVHRRDRRRRARSPTSALLRDELEDRFGPVPEPLENLIALQQARIKLGQAGARVVSFRGGLLAVTPIDLDAEQAQRAARASARGALRAGPQPGLLARPATTPRSAFRAVVARRRRAAGGHGACGGPDGSLTSGGYHDRSSVVPDLE